MLPIFTLGLFCIICFSGSSPKACGDDSRRPSALNWVCFFSPFTDDIDVNVCDVSSCIIFWRFAVLSSFERVLIIFERFLAEIGRNGTFFIIFRTFQKEPVLIIV